MENTYYITVLENSLDDMFHLTHLENNKKKKKFSSMEIKDIREYLEDLDANATEYLKKASNYEASNEEVQIMKTEIRIRIPGFTDNFRVIDSPGMTLQAIRDNFFSFLNDNCLLNVFLIVRNIQHKKVTDKDFVITTNRIIIQFTNSLSCLILSHVDKLIDTNNERSLKKYGQNLKLFFKSFYEKSGSLKHIKTSITSSFKAIRGNHIYQEGIKKLKDKLIEIEKNYAIPLLITRIKNKLRLIVEQFNSSISVAPTLLTLDEEEQITWAMENAYHKYREDITKFISKDLISFETFKDTFSLEINKLKETFIETDKKVLTGKYARRNSYIEDQVQYLAPQFQKEIVDIKMCRLDDLATTYFLQKLTPELRRKVQVIILVGKKLLIARGGIVRRNSCSWSNK